MPRIKRWFPVSHDINRDPEVWELTDKFGLSGLRCWLEILSIADRNDGQIPGDAETVLRALSIASNSTQRHVRGILEFTQRRLWLSSELPLTVSKWAKYHRTEVRNVVPTRPNQTEPDLIREEKKKSKSAVPEFPPDWIWLKTFVENLNGNFPKERFLDFSWWDAVSETCGGVSEEWLTVQFAAMKRWILDNPSREPTPKGYRRFVASWLERSYERERRFGNATTKK